MLSSGGGWRASSDCWPRRRDGLTIRPTTSGAPLSPARVVVIHNDTNRGFAAGCNQGLARPRGEYLVLLNNDTIVTPGWLEGLIALSLADWPRIGMTGPVTSWAAAPQQVAIDYRSLDGLDAFAARRRREYAGQALQRDLLRPVRRPMCCCRKAATGR